MSKVILVLISTFFVQSIFAFDFGGFADENGNVNDGPGISSEHTPSGVDENGIPTGYGGEADNQDTNTTGALYDAGVQAITGPASEAKYEALRSVISFPSYYPGLAFNSSFRVDVRELDIKALPNGKRGFFDPVTGKPSAVKAEAIRDNRGNIIGATISIPGVGVGFVTGTGDVVAHRAFVVHEMRHADQFARGIFGMHTDFPDLQRAEKDAQKIENRFTGLSLSYYNSDGTLGNKHNGGGYFDANGGIEQGRGNTNSPQFSGYAGSASSQGNFNDGNELFDGNYPVYYSLLSDIYIETALVSTLTF